MNNLGTDGTGIPYHPQPAPHAQTTFHELAGRSQSHGYTPTRPLDFPTPRPARSTCESSSIPPCHQRTEAHRRHSSCRIPTGRCAPSTDADIAKNPRSYLSWRKQRRVRSASNISLPSPLSSTAAAAKFSISIAGHDRGAESRPVVIHSLLATTAPAGCNIRLCHCLHGTGAARWGGSRRRRPSCRI